MSLLSSSSLSRLRSTALGAVALASAALGLSACVTDGDVSNPITRKVSYFSYLNGDDLRAACHAGADDHLRLIYNGRYNDQVRLYELSPHGGQPVLEQKVLAPLIVNQGLNLASIGNSLHGIDHSSLLGTDHAQALWDEVIKAGALTPATAGRRLDSEDLWWVAVGCYQGKTFFHVWEQDEQSGLPPFAETVKALDAVTDVPWPPQKDPRPQFMDSANDRSKRSTFILETTTTGFYL